MRVGFIGLGAMGLPMARNLRSAGFDVVVHNRSRGKVDDFVAEGGTAAATAADLAASVDVVCACMAPLVSNSGLTSVPTARTHPNASAMLRTKNTAPILTHRLVEVFGVLKPEPWQSWLAEMLMLLPKARRSLTQ